MQTSNLARSSGTEKKLADDIINVNCVFGRGHHRHLLELLIPSLQLATSRPVRFNVMNYAGPSHLDQFPGGMANIDIRVFEQTRGRAIGFAEAHNLMADHCSQSDFFIIINPDCVLHEGAIDVLIDRYHQAEKPVGIVEGRQWPFEHPKEYDPVRLTTPWASGAFCLFDRAIYQRIGGMDDRFFLYLEDVDISWRMWLAGASVIHEPKAVTTHFTGGYFYRDDLLENEKYYSIRNFILILRKFFGPKGEEKAQAMLKEFPDQELVRACLADIQANFSDFLPLSDLDVRKYPQIKVTGINLFHEIRT